MFIQRFVLVLAIVAAAAPLAAQTLNTNGGFAPSGTLTGDGSMPPNEIRGWAAAYGTPQIAAEGCGGPGAIAMWGNQAAGEAIRQPVALYKNVRYEVSLCARRRDGPNAHVVFRTSAMPLANPACAAGCELATVAKDVPSDWVTYQLQFTPSADSVYLTLGTTNDVAAVDGAQSLVEVDDVVITVADRGPGALAPLIHEGMAGTIPHQYIVLFREGTSPADVTDLMGEVDKAGVELLFKYTSDILGFAVNLTSNPAVLETIRMNEHVLWVEKDQRVSPSDGTQTSRVPFARGIDRIDRRLLPLNGTFQSTETGQGVHAYVFDTGVSPHNEFGNRLSGGWNVFTSSTDAADCNGHGTHVAGTLAGTTYGIAKNATIHPVRVMRCNGSGEDSAVIAGVDWLTANKLLPAVANLSISSLGTSPSLDLKITNSIAAGITYVVAAHNRGADACNYSPARIPDAITVGAVNPQTDVRYVVSNYGPCVDVFAPGVAILSAWNTSTTATAVKGGTSMAAPHAAGVAALYLQTNPTATPADVWNKIHANNNVTGTPNWQGIANPGPPPNTLSSPNELLHWGALKDGYDDGDPHLTTVDGTHYNFQSAGEFVLLRGDGGMEIQTRQTPVATMFDPPADPYDGLATCMSINTAVAARVGSHRVTYQPNLDGVPDPSGMQLRIDGTLASLSAKGIDLGGGGRIVPTPAGGGIEIHFPDDTVLTALPRWWSSQETWFLNVHVNRTRATKGIMGELAQGSWLPALPDGRSLGPMPPSLPQRFIDLNQTFANAWRVTDSSSLFDYAPGTSTATFTDANWPPEHPPCNLNGGTPANPASRGTAQKACRGVRGEKARADCIFDVLVTGEEQFARAYLLSEQLRRGATSTIVGSFKNPSDTGERVMFVATVALLAPRVSADGSSVIPSGTVQFVVDGAKTGAPVPLDADGRASWTASKLSTGTHTVSARYLPAKGSEFLTSGSADRSHLVVARKRGGNPTQRPSMRP